MKTFWIIIVALALAGAALFLTTRRGQDASALPDQTQAPSPSSRQGSSSDLPSATGRPAALAPQGNQEAPAAPSSADPLADLKAQADTPVPAKPATVTPEPISAQTPHAESASPSAHSMETPAPDTIAGTSKPFAFPVDAKFPPDRIVASKGVSRADGSVLMDDRFVVKGSGTKDDPYRVTWEQLVSAQDVYKPRLGQKRLPQRVTFLNDKYVRLAGFVAFPITSNNPRECLVMLNQWDGCCIGVPPTAYDAVEVKLSKPATGNDRLAMHGTLEGKFRVDPFEEGGWLLGLYLMDDAVLKPDL